MGGGVQALRMAWGPHRTLLVPIPKLRRKSATPGGHFTVLFCTQAKSFAGETSPNSGKVKELLYQIVLLQARISGV